MKTLISLAVIMIIAGLFYSGMSFSEHKKGIQSPESAGYIIVTYFPYMGTPYVHKGGRAGFRIFRGDGNIEYVILTEEERKLDMPNAAVNVLGKLKAEGYSLVMTNEIGNVNASTEVYWYLKKE